jgi:hypothetical protein
MPNRMARREKGWTSWSATLVAMKENPQKMTAHSAGQDTDSLSFHGLSVLFI